MKIAQGDIDSAAEKLMARGERIGGSRYAFLKAAMKLLNAAINLQGARRVHQLKDLADKPAQQCRSAACRAALNDR